MAAGAHGGVTKLAGAEAVVVLDDPVGHASILAQSALGVL
jgi:hypothetical protein